MKFSAQISTVTDSISSTVERRRTRSTVAAAALAGLVVLTAFLAGGYYESTYSLLAAAVWLAVAIAAAFAPPPRPSAAAIALLLLALLTTASAAWGQPGAAFRVAPLVALYAGALYVAEWVGARPLLALLRIAVFGVVAAAVVARIAGVEPDTPGPESDRLAWPVTYANGLGLVAVTAVLLLAGVPSARPRLMAVAAAVAGAAAYLTYSRSALLAGVAAAMLLLALRPEAARALTAAAAGGAATAAVDVLGATDGPILLAALTAAALVAWWLPPLRLRISRRAAVAAAVPAAIAAAVLAQPLAARFAAPAPDERGARRLVDVSGHGRAHLWRSAWEQGAHAPVVGNGAGTWGREHVEREHDLAAPANAHSLYLETFAELGVAGLALLLAFLALAAAQAARTPAALAAGAAWAVQAGVDWTWQLPAATLTALLAVGAAAARRPLPAVAAVPVAAAALAIGVACGLHGVGAALLESGVRTRAEADRIARLLPRDARPYTGAGLIRRACAVDRDDPALRRVLAPRRCPQM